MKELQREARELKPSNDILRKAAAFFAHADLDRKPKRWRTLSISIMMFDGIEPICKEPPIAPSPHHHYKIRAQYPQRRSARVKCDEQLAPEIQRV